MLGVTSYIVKKHKIASDKISTEGFGETKPIADNGNFQGRQKNRRVEMIVSGDAIGTWTQSQ
jgi:outer membrane protein OmpA-like peptidoglycan-associated protein